MNSIDLKIVAKGLSDIHLLRKLLSDELTAGVRFYASQGRASLATVGRNILVHEGGPVLLVMDADTLSSQARQELEAMTTVAMSGAASGGAFVSWQGSFKVFTFLPAIEVVFFEAPAVLEKAIGRALPSEILKEGLASPKPTLTKLLAEAGKSDLDMLSRQLDEPSIDALRTGKQATALRASVRPLLRVASLA